MKIIRVVISPFLIFCVYLLTLTVNGFAAQFPISHLINDYPPCIKYASLHHTELRAREHQKQLSMVNQYHKEKWGEISSLGWYVGYNWFCDVDGKLTKVRSLRERTMAQLKHNYDTESICLAGNFNVDMPTNAQEKTLRKWILERSFLDFKFHRELNKHRTCPGVNISRKWINNLISDRLLDQTK